MNKVVLITGASRGIGRATAIKFARQGYDVVINYNSSEEKANELKQLIEKDYNVNATAYKADVSNEQEVKEMIDIVVNKYGKIDTLVNNAGIVYDRNFENITIYEFKRTLDVNIIGAFIVARECSKHMEKGGTIVNVSSTNGTKTISPECLDYNISKVGLQSLTRDLAFQFKPDIRVNAVAIGWADTDMNKDLPKEYIEEENNKIYLERFSDPSEIANAIYFLASEESSYINGEILTIDGGY
ncbi:MAG: SDR family NAD(P)-dependent oxidoreductase [Candidatus Scatovivens sp.]